MTAIKGDAVRFIAGKYGGKSGWVNLAETADDEILPVIVNLGRKGEKVTFVYQSSARLITITNVAPTSYAEAVIKHCPDIEKALVELSRKLAKCDIKRDSSGFHAVIIAKVDEAIACFASYSSSSSVASRVVSSSHDCRTAQSCCRKLP
jgi:ribosomal protein L24